MLYSKVNLQSQLGRAASHARVGTLQRIQCIREHIAAEAQLSAGSMSDGKRGVAHMAVSLFCDVCAGSEQVIDTEQIRRFYARHEGLAKLQLRYPAATVHEETLPSLVIDSLRRQYVVEEPYDIDLRWKRSCSYLSDCMSALFMFEIHGRRIS